MENNNDATYEDLLTDICAADDRVVVMTAENRAAIRNIPDRIGGKFIDVGICEQTMIGAAAGLALRGRIPIVHALSTFLTLRAFEFIRDDVGIPHLPVKLVGAVPGFLSDGNGPTHQAIEDVGIMRLIPGMRIFCPADREELLAALPSIVDDGNPWYIRYNASEPTLKHGGAFEPGRAEVYSHGNDVAIVTYGFLTREAQKAMAILTSKGITVRLINLRTLSPVDEDAILDAIREAELLVTVEDHFHVGGLAAIVSDIIVRKRVMTHVLNLSLNANWFHPALLPDVLAHEGFDGNSIASRILDHV
jgi:transketolase